MELYLLKSAAILAVLFIFYKLVLENTSIHNFKRAYLLGSLLASFLIPLITFTNYVEVSSILSSYTEGASQVAHIETGAVINYWPIVLWTIYGLGVLFFSMKFFRNLFNIVQQIRKNPKYRDRSFINILLREAVIPHTFFSYIFLNKKQFETGKIPAEVLLHEEAHASQRHSLDIILIEILKIIFWFNPLFYFFKRSIKLNHEFLADEAVLNNGIETSAYQKLLLAFSTPENHQGTLTPSLAHSINYSSMKKRFSIMKTHTSRRTIIFRSLLILPLLSFLIYGFSTKETIERHADSSYIFTNDTIEDIQIKIDENSKISLNGKPVALSSLKAEINKLNTELTIEEKQKYLSASIEVENESLRDLAGEVGNILQSCNITSYNVANLKGQRDAGIKHIPQKNPMAGKTIEEAEVLHQQYLKELEEFKKSRTNVKKDENNPWTIVKETNNRDETAEKIIQQKATKAELADYNKLAKKYNAIPTKERKIAKKDFERLETIFKKMSDSQKVDVEPFPKFLPIEPTIRKSKNSSSSINMDGAIFYYNNTEITKEKAKELLQKNNKLRVYITKLENGNGTIVLSETPIDTSNKETRSLPSTLINTSSETNKAISDATYYYNDMVISPKKADELLKTNNKLRVYITKTEFGKGIITLSETPIPTKSDSYKKSN